MIESNQQVNDERNEILDFIFKGFFGFFVLFRFVENLNHFVFFFVFSNEK